MARLFSQTHEVQPRKKEHDGLLFFRVRGAVMHDVFAPSIAFFVTGYLLGAVFPKHHSFSITETVATKWGLAPLSIRPILKESDS